MEQKDKELLLKDLCARLPYGVRIHVEGWGDEVASYYFQCVDITNTKLHLPYLRPMSSMTEDERSYYKALLNGNIGESILSAAIRMMDWLNEHHFDFRNLIERNLAIAVTNENNPYK